MEYPKGNAEGRRLFQTLLDRMERRQYDDDFLAGLVAYQAIYPASEKFDLFFARYALFHGNTEVALEYARAAEKKRPLNYLVWRLLAEVLTARDDGGTALRGALCSVLRGSYFDDATAKRVGRFAGNVVESDGAGNLCAVYEQLDGHDRSGITRPKAYADGRVSAFPAGGKAGVVGRRVRGTGTFGSEKLAGGAA